MTDENGEITESCGNVFADMGLPNPEEELINANLTYEIFRTAQEKSLSAAALAELAKIDLPTAETLLRNRSGDLSISDLILILTRLGRDVEIKVREAKQSVGALLVG
jgi:predicted XRE-type DNA-binding protein